MITHAQLRQARFMCRDTIRQGAIAIGQGWSRRLRSQPALKRWFQHRWLPIEARILSLGLSAWPNSATEYRKVKMFYAKLDVDWAIHPVHPSLIDYKTNQQSHAAMVFDAAVRLVTVAGFLSPSDRNRTVSCARRKRPGTALLLHRVLNPTVLRASQ